MSWSFTVLWHKGLLCNDTCCGLCLCTQEQYQYLYKAMLSLVGNRECDLGPMNMDTNGVVVIADESDPAESMESLVWEHSYRHLICKNFSEAFFCQTID